ncbi:vacuolar protein sorting/targeting protein PEP1 [Rhizophlyctis rosea]|nr:vacuolar protein sorting/targeting protein PEP1 [Rhizophlyctis rosea]
MASPTKGSRTKGWGRFFKRLPLSYLLLATLVVASTLQLSVAEPVVSSDTFELRRAVQPALDKRASAVEVNFEKLEHFPSKIFYFAESQVVLFLDPDSHTVWRSADEGKKWTKVSDSEGKAFRLMHHSFDKLNRAVILSDSKEHWYTTDKGETWRKFTTDLKPSKSAKSVLAFNAQKPDYILLALEDCTTDGWFETCHDKTVYTTDGFKSTPKTLLEYTFDCSWANASPEFKYSSDDGVFCIQWPDFMQKPDVSRSDSTKLRLVTSNDYFPNGKGELIDRNGGVVGMGFAKGFMVLAVKTPYDTLEMHVSKDGKTFVTGKFPLGQGLSQDAYTILDSSVNRLAVDLLAAKSSAWFDPPYGHLFFSNSDGGSFVQTLNHTNRASTGRVDFERIQAPDFESILYANVVGNWKELDSSGGWGSVGAKQLVTMMSWNDGSTWEKLTPPGDRARDCRDKDNCNLHLHMLTEAHNIGRVLSTPGAPGLLIGVGSVGAYLRPYDQSDTYLSRDAGKTWTFIAKGPHKYESLDMGGLIALVPDGGRTDQFLYSWDQGNNWEKQTVKFDDTKEFKVHMTTLDPDSTSRKMLMLVMDADNPRVHYMVQLDFSALDKRQCGNSDFEMFKFGKNECVLGREVEYKRRKEKADCYVGQKFKQPETTVTKCKCTDMDWECDTGYVAKSGTFELVCVAVDEHADQPADCKVGTKYDGTSGYRKVPGSVCENGVWHPDTQKKECVKKERKPGGVVSPPSGGTPTSKRTNFGSDVSQVLYFPNTTVVLIRTEDGDVWRSGDEGETWKQVLKGYEVDKMVAHEAKEKRGYFLTGKDVLWTDDALETDSVMKLEPPNGVKANGLGLPILDFHPTQPDWLVFLGGANDCPTVPASDCHTETWITKDHGKKWMKVETWASKCVWGRDFKFVDKEVEEDSVYCMSWKYKIGNFGQDELELWGAGKDNELQLVEINDGGERKKYVVDKGVVAFYVVENVMVVAQETGGDLKLLVSTQGEVYKEAVFPPNLKINKNSFTVLESSTGSIFLDVGQSSLQGKEYGMLFKSNFNGTYYSKMLDFTNRNSAGEVDFEKIQGINGIILANKVTNAVSSGSKAVASVMSFDDGATWTSIPAPKYDGGDTCDISKGCSLHFHAHGSTYLKPSVTSMHSAKHAPGLVIAVGNTGTKLKPYTEGDVYISRDAGRTWNMVFKDAHKWAIGDHGGVIVLADDEKETDELKYSWDFGKSWAKYVFTDRKIRVRDIHTHPTATSLKFIVTGTYKKGSSVWDKLWGDDDGGDVVTVTVDFSNLLVRKCEKGSDFEKWSPGAVNGGERCFLGEKATYSRRREDAVCYVGEEFGDEGETFETCSCTRDDYECDVGFFRDSDGECQLAGGHDPLEAEKCKNLKEGDTYKGSSGYRKISISKCKGGKDMTEPVDRVCGKDHEQNGPIKMATKIFDSSLADYFYFNHSATLVMRDQADTVWISYDNGKSWEEKLRDVPKVVQDPFRGNRAYFLGDSEKVHWTDDNGGNFREFKAPTKPSNIVPMSNILKTHGTDANLLIWIGQTKECDDLSSSEKCHNEAWYSTNHGGKWYFLYPWVEQCLWGDNGKFGIKDKRAVFCLAIDEDERKGDQRVNRDSGTREVWKTKDVGKGEKGFEKVLEDVVKGGVALFDEFLVAARRRYVLGSKEGLKLDVTIDGETWAEAQFPKGYAVSDHGFTVLESSTGSIFLDMILSQSRGQESGTMMISNGNGTFFKTSLEYVNQDDQGYVDFEKIQGVEGIAMVNQISNYPAVKGGSDKKLTTKMSWDDGNKWQYLKRPDADSNGDAYSCRGDYGCSLHIHSYTERRDKRDQFTSSGAVGLIMGVGNVGAYLNKYTNGDVFISRDAGRSWKEVIKNAHRYEFGDQGAIILMVNDEEPTDSVVYTKNQGKTLHDYKITADTGGKIRVNYLISEPSGTTSHFVIFGKVTEGPNRGKTAIIHLDFTGIWEGAACKMSEDEKESDFEAWSPSLAGGKGVNGSCWFGKEVTYYRRKADRECHVNKLYKDPKVVEKACPCTEDDYECAPNYVSDGNGKCVLAAGAVQPEAWCDEVEGVLRKQTGYVKSKKTSCMGGVALEMGESVGWCATKSVGAGAIFGYTILAFGLAAVVSFGFWRYRERFGLGRIRLPMDTIETTRSGTATFLQTALVVATEAGERFLSLCRTGIDWVKGKLRRGAGYAPVGGEAGGIVWEDEDAVDDY